MNKKLSALKNLALVSQIGISMVVPIVGGLYLGKWIDQRLGTQPIFLFLFIIIGVATSFMNLFKLTQREKK